MQRAIESVSTVQFNAWTQETSNWGCWGKGDQLGMLNLITTERALAATKLGHRGENSLDAAAEQTRRSHEWQSLCHGPHPVYRRRLHWWPYPG